MRSWAMLVAALAAAIAWGMYGGGDDARAMGLCDCCAKSLSPSCGKVCAASDKLLDMCVATVDYDGTGLATSAPNPLNGLSLKELTLGDPTPWQLELFRRFLESGRAKAIVSYDHALDRLERREIERTELDGEGVIYREALVNYYHGIRAYLIRVGSKPD